MKLIFNSSIIEDSIYNTGSKSFENSQKIGSNFSDNFNISDTDKKSYVLDTDNDFSLDIVSLLPLGKHFSFINIDIYDTDSSLMESRQFKLTLNDIDLGKVAQFSLLNIQQSYNIESLIIDDIELDTDKQAILVIYLGFKDIQITTSTTTSTTTTTTT